MCQVFRVRGRGYVPGVDVAGTAELRRGLLAVSVLHDLDVVPDDDGVVLPGPPEVHVPWEECATSLAGRDPESPAGRALLAGWLQALRWVADIGVDELPALLRPVGLPVEHLVHPGPTWVREAVRGGALDLGLGAVGLDPAGPDRVVPLPGPVLESVGIDPDAAWPAAAERLERLGGYAAERLRTDSKGVLRPFGDCDVVTLLGSQALRSDLAAGSGGMATALAPMRRRGWTQLRLLDPAFGPAAAAATPPVDRGFPRPLLVTADELVQVAEGGRPEDVALRDPAPGTPWDRDVLYR